MSQTFEEQVNFIPNSDVFRYLGLLNSIACTSDICAEKLIECGILEVIQDAFCLRKTTYWSVVIKALHCLWALLQASENKLIQVEAFKELPAIYWSMYFVYISLKSMRLKNLYL